MYLEKTEIGEQRSCGFILKPFDDEWVFRPNYGNWTVIPLDSCRLSDNEFSFTTQTSQYYEIPNTRFSTISGKAILVSVRSLNIGYAVARGVDKITFNRDDLYTKRYGIVVQTGMPATFKHIAISILCGINIRSDEINNPIPEYNINAGKLQILSQSAGEKSGIKTGQFIL